MFWGATLVPSKLDLSIAMATFISPNAYAALASGILPAETQEGILPAETQEGILPAETQE